MNDWEEEGRRAAGRLLQTGELLSGKPGGMIDRLRMFAEAEAAAEPFLAAVNERLDGIRADIAGLIGAAPDDPKVYQLLGDRDSEAAREVRSLYGITLKVAREPEARDLVVDLSANRAFRSLTDRFADIAVELTAHLQEFGWVRTLSGLDLLSPKEAMQRMQLALLRWNAETIALAADPPPDKKPEIPEEVAELVAEYLALSGDPAFGPGHPVKARWTARLFFGEVASAVDRPLHQVLNTPAQALIDAVESGKGLPDQPAAEPLSGAAVSLGRAVGRVRVVLDADEGGKVQVGDIIVTNLSTPTYEGQPSIFPYRTVPSVPIDKSAAIVADEGGLLSHAAIVCRENQVPIILGTERATEVLRDGMIVEVDATRAAGSVTVLAW
jgi:phosphohistidine swiveling domain-containing protein